MLQSVLRKLPQNTSFLETGKHSLCELERLNICQTQYVPNNDYSILSQYISLLLYEGGKKVDELISVMCNVLLERKIRVEY